MVMGVSDGTGISKVARLFAGIKGAEQAVRAAR